MYTERNTAVQHNTLFINKYKILTKFQDKTDNESWNWMHHFEEQKLAENKETIVETDMFFPARRSYQRTYCHCRNITWNESDLSIKSLCLLWITNSIHFNKLFWLFKNNKMSAESLYHWLLRKCKWLFINDPQRDFWKYNYVFREFDISSSSSPVYPSCPDYHLKLFCFWFLA